MKSKSYFIPLISLLLASLPLPLIVSTLVLTVLIAYTIYYAIVNHSKPVLQKEQYVFIAFYALSAISYFWSINKPLSLIGVERKVAFVLIPLLFTVIPPFKQQERNQIFYNFTIAMTAYALFFILSGSLFYFQTGSLENLTHHKLVSPLNLNRIYVSLFTSVALLYQIIKTKRSKQKTSMLVILSVFLILLSSKTIIITTLLLVLFYILKKNLSFNKKALFLPLFILTILLVSNKVNPRFFSELIPSKYKEIIHATDFKKNYYFNGAELRIFYTRFLAEYIREKPSLLLSGFGLNASQEMIAKKCVNYRVPDGYGTTYNFHNQFNQTLAETGVITVLLILYLFFIALKRSWKNTDFFGFVAIFILFMLMNTESIFNRQRGMYFFLIVYFLIFATKTNELQSNK